MPPSSQASVPPENDLLTMIRLLKHLQLLLPLGLVPASYHPTTTKVPLRFSFPACYCCRLVQLITQKMKNRTNLKPRFTTNRRAFLQTVGLAALGTSLAPAIHAQDKAGARPIIVGAG